MQLAERPVLDTYPPWNRSFAATVSPVNDHLLANCKECCEEILSVYNFSWPSNETSVGGRVRVSPWVIFPALGNKVIPQQWGDIFISPASGDMGLVPHLGGHGHIPRIGGGGHGHAPRAVPPHCPLQSPTIHCEAVAAAASTGEECFLSLDSELHC
jgi:hypothetical protein